MEVYTGLTTLEKAFVILDECGLKALMTGFLDEDINVEKITKADSDELKKAGSYFYKIATQLFKEKKLREFYEVITHKKTRGKDIEIKLVVEAIVNFSKGIVSKVPRSLLMELMKVKA